MNKVVKLQLLIFAFFCLYFIIRLIAVSPLQLSVWQSVYWGNIIKDSFGLLISLVLTYYLFNLLRLNHKTGPSIIQGSQLKFGLFFLLGLWWLAIILHLLFDSVKLILPLSQFDFYHWADFLDETISHIFLYVPVVIVSAIGLLLEVERPSQSGLTKLELIIIAGFGLLAGIMFGLNLTEGRLSLQTSFPAMILYLCLFFYLTIKYRLNLKYYPYGLSYAIVYLFASLSFIFWGLAFHSFPEFFNYLK